MTSPAGGAAGTDSASPTESLAVSGSFRGRLSKKSFYKSTASSFFSLPSRLGRRTAAQAGQGGQGESLQPVEALVYEKLREGFGPTQVLHQDCLSDHHLLIFSRTSSSIPSLVLVPRLFRGAVFLPGMGGGDRVFPSNCSFSCVAGGGFDVLRGAASIHFDEDSSHDGSS